MAGDYCRLQPAAACAYVVGDLCLLCVLGPLKRGPVEQNVSNVESRSALHQQANDVVMAAQRGLMQRRRMRVNSVGVVTVRVFTGVQKQGNNLGVPVLCGKCQCPMTTGCVRVREGLARIVEATSGSGCGQVQFLPLVVFTLTF
jgi:hypothetical protein